MMVAEVKTLTNRSSVSASLRKLADQIDAGELEPRFACLALVTVKGSIAGFGWGNCSDLEISGAFARASVLSGCCVPDVENEE